MRAPLRVSGVPPKEGSGTGAVPALEEADLPAGYADRVYHVRRSVLASAWLSVLGLAMLLAVLVLSFVHDYCECPWKIKRHHSWKMVNNPLCSGSDEPCCGVSTTRCTNTRQPGTIQCPSISCHLLCVPRRNPKLP